MTVAELLKAALRNAALRTCEARQGWRNFKKDAAKLWQYQRFRFEPWFSQIWPFRSPAWLISLHALKGLLGFGKPGEGGDVMYLPDDHPIFDPKSTQLSTAEVVRRAFGHVTLTGQMSWEVARQREKRLARIVIGLEGPIAGSGSNLPLDMSAE